MATIRDLYNDPQKPLIKKALDIFIDTYQEVTGKGLDVSDAQAVVVNANTLIFGEDALTSSQNTKHDTVLLDVAHENVRTLLYFSNSPNKGVLNVWSAPEETFSEPNVAFNYPVEYFEDEEFCDLVKMALVTGPTSYGLNPPKLG